MDRSLMDYDTIAKVIDRGSRWAKLARRVAPADVDTCPIYWHISSEMPADLMTGKAPIGGYCCHANDQYRDSKIGQCYWRGPGFLIVISDIEGDSTAIHELAHAMESAIPKVVDVPLLKNTEQAFTTWYAVRHEFPEIPLWTGHGANWIRAAIHLGTRAIRCGMNVKLQDFTIAGENYGLSHVDRYAEALAEELAATPDSESIRELLKRPFPTAFADLFRSDTGKEPS